jgi:hypothetical protein
MSPGVGVDFVGPPSDARAGGGAILFAGGLSYSVEGTDLVGVFSTSLKPDFDSH